MRVPVGTDRQGRPLYAYRGHATDYQVPHLPARHVPAEPAAGRTPPDTSDSERLRHRLLTDDAFRERVTRETIERWGAESTPHELVITNMLAHGYHHLRAVENKLRADGLWPVLPDPYSPPGEEHT